MESVHTSMCARREARTGRLIGAPVDVLPGNLFLDQEHDVLQEGSLLDRIVDVLYDWV